MITSAKKTFFIALTTLSVVTASNSNWVPGGSSDLANPNPPPVGDWSSGLPNVNATDIGTFTGNGAPNPNLTSTLTLSNLDFDSTSPTYSLGLTSPADLTITGQVTIDAPQFQFWTVDGTGGSSSLTFSGNSPTSEFVFLALLSGDLNITGPVGTSVQLTVAPDATSVITVNQNQLQVFPAIDFEGTVNLVNPTAQLLITGGTNTINASIIGAGSLAIDAEFLTLTGPNSYSGGTFLTDNSSLFMIGAGTLSPIGALNFDVNNPTTFDISQATTNPFTVGDLIGGEYSISPTFISLGANTLQAGTANSTTFNGGIVGIGTFVKQGTGTLELTEVSEINNILINQGNLNLNDGVLISTVTVQQNGTFSGGNEGAVIGQVQVLSGGTIAPGIGNNPDSLFIDGTYFEETGSTYLVGINGATNSLIRVEGGPGTATLTGGEVVVNPVGPILFDHPYEILTANNVIGRFDGVRFGTSSVITPVLIYPPSMMSVFLELQPSFINVAHTYNQKQVANQLDSLGSLDQIESTVLDAIFALSPDEASHVLDELSGDQYSVDPFAFSILNREFIRRLYDPLRSIITSLPCERCCDTNCVDVWLEAGWDRIFLQNDGNGFGFNLTGWEISGGLQKTFSDWTFGLGGSFEHDYIHYNLAGTGNLNSGFAGIYGLYRPNNFYVLADLAFGFSDNSLIRKITIGTFTGEAKSSPQTQGVTFYAEAGIDFPVWCLLLQPFVGIETTSYRRGPVAEAGISDFDLLVRRKEDTTALSRLGLHLSTTEIYRGISLSLDAAWDYQYTKARNDFRAEFASFGDEFTIRGAKIGHSSFEGAATLLSQVTDCVNAYVEFSGQIWKEASTYNLLVGAQMNW